MRNMNFLTYKEHMQLVRNDVLRNSHESTQNLREKEKKGSHLLSKIYCSLHNSMTVRP